MREDAGSEMRFQGDEEGERAVLGILIGTFMGVLIWLIAGYYFYWAFIA